MQSLDDLVGLMVLDYAWGSFKELLRVTTSICTSTMLGLLSSAQALRLVVVEPLC